MVSLDMCDNKTSLDTASPDGIASSFHAFRDSSEFIANILFAYNLRVCMNPCQDVFLVNNPFSLFGVVKPEQFKRVLNSKSNKKKKKTKKASCYPLFQTNFTTQRVTPRVHYVGLRNLGATCYMNCYLQTLFMNPDFRYRIFSLEDSTLCQQNETNILYELKKLFYSLQSGATHVADPSGIARELHISTENQGDATEFATLLLMTLEKHLGGKTSDRNFIPELFRGCQTQRMTCKSCSKVSVKTEDFYELRVQLFPNNTNNFQEEQFSNNPHVISSQEYTNDQVSRSLKKLKKKTRALRTTESSSNVHKIVSLEDALTHALRCETLRDDNRYMCDGCQRKVNAERQVFLTSLPPYLHICFERYAYQLDSRQKLTTLVDYPLTLNLSKYSCRLDSDHIIFNKNNNTSFHDTQFHDYELIAVLEHQGSSALTGHYVAYIRDEDATFQNVDQSSNLISSHQDTQQESKDLQENNNTTTNLISDKEKNLFCKSKKSKKSSTEQLKQTLCKRYKLGETKKSIESNKTGHILKQTFSSKENIVPVKSSLPSTPQLLIPVVSTSPQCFENVQLSNELKNKTTTLFSQTNNNQFSVTQDTCCNMKKSSLLKPFQLNKEALTDKKLFTKCKSSKIALVNDSNPCASLTDCIRGPFSYCQMDPFYQAAACYFLSHYSQRLPFQVQPLSLYQWCEQPTTRSTTTPYMTASLPTMSPYMSSPLATMSSYPGMTLQSTSPYTDMPLQSPSLYNAFPLQAASLYTGMPLPSSPPYTMSILPFASNYTTRSLQTNSSSTDRPVHSNVSVSQNTNDLNTLEKMQISHMHVKSPHPSLYDTSLPCTLSSKQSSSLGSFDSILNPIKSYDELMHQTSHNAYSSPHIPHKSNVGDAPIQNSFSPKIVPTTTFLDPSQPFVTLQNTSLEKCRDEPTKKIQLSYTHSHQKEPTHSNTSNSQVIHISETSTRDTCNTQTAKNVQTNVMIFKEEKNVKEKVTIPEENQLTQVALNFKKIKEYNKSVGTTLFQISDTHEKQVKDQMSYETKTLSDINSKSTNMLKTHQTDDKLQKKSQIISNKIKQDAFDTVNDQEHVDEQSPTINNSNVPLKKWSWIQFDDATVSEWKIENHLYNDRQKNVTNINFSPIDVSKARLCSESAYLILYKTKHCIPTALVTQKKYKSVNFCTEPSELQEKPCFDQGLKIQKKSNDYNDVYQKIRFFQEQCNALKKEKYCVTNEWPLLECCLNWMVFVPMHWWTRFLNEIQTLECVSYVPDKDGLKNTTNVKEKKLLNKQDLKQDTILFKTSLTCSMVNYNEILCPHSTMVLQSSDTIIDKWPEAFREDKEKIFNTENKCQQFSIDPLAVWNGTAKLISKNLIKDVFKIYQLKANIPYIEFSRVVCLKCANGFSHLVDYWYEQGILLHELKNLLRFQDLVKTKYMSKEESLKDENILTDKVVLFKHDTELPKEDYVWISKECLTRVKARFTLREKHGKHRKRVYTLEDATEDVLCELYRLREIHKNNQLNRTKVENDGTDTCVVLSHTDTKKEHMLCLSDTTENETNLFVKETTSFETNQMDEKNNLCFGIVCCHGFLVPDKKATVRRALVPKLLLERFLYFEELKANLLVKDFCIAPKCILMSKIFVKPILPAVCLKKQSKVKASSNTLKIVDEIQQTCHICEMALKSSRQKEFIWKSERMSEKVSLGHLVFKRYCKLYQLEHIKRHTSYCLYPGKHYLISTQWLSQYTTGYLMAKNEETAIYPKQINGNVLMTTCCHQGQEKRRCLMYDPAAYLKNDKTFSFHPKENPRHPESDIYFLCYEDDFVKLEALYGSCNVPYLQVVLQMTLDSNDTAAHVDYSYSVLTCRQCVLSTWFQEGGKGFFQNIPLQLRVQSSRIPLTRQLSRRHVFTVSGNMLVNSLLLKIASALFIPHECIINQTCQVFLKGPVIPPFYEAVNIQESDDKNFETMPNDIFFQKVNAINSNSSLASGYFSNGTLYCCMRLRLNSTKSLKRIRVGSGKPVKKIFVLKKFLFEPLEEYLTFLTEIKVNMSYSIAGYTLGTTLGMGTFGKVKLAVHDKTAVQVAIKIINKEKMISLGVTDSVRREISILKHLHHPHVVRLYELIDTPTDIFMVMEYVPGGELFDYIVQRSKISENEARRFFQQIVCGIEYCHRHGVCHRDLKPENILIDSHNNLKICDFGLGTFLREGNFLNTSCGSPNYAAPEVISGSLYSGPEIDVWSCAVILYATLCGCLPFDDEHVPNLFKKIKQGKFYLPDFLSSQSADLLSSMLVVDPIKRITLREVKRHEWFRLDLPPYLKSSNCFRIFMKELIHERVVANTIKMGYKGQKNMSCFSMMKKNRSSFNVTYHILAGKKMTELSSSENQLKHQVQQRLHLSFPKETQKKTAIRCMYMGPDKLGVFHSTTSSNVFYECPHYNTNVFDSSYSKFSFKPTSSSFFASGPILSHRIPSMECTWVLGTVLKGGSFFIFETICRLLKFLQYEWYIVNMYKLRCRKITDTLSSQNSNIPCETSQNSVTTSSSQLLNNTSFSSSNTLDGYSDCTLLDIQLYKISHTQHLLDIQAFDGPILEGLSEGVNILLSLKSLLKNLFPMTDSYRPCRP